MTTARYGTFEEDTAPWKETGGPRMHGVIDSETGAVFGTVGPETSKQLADLLNLGLKRQKADYVAGYEQCQKNMSLPGIESARTMHLCFDEYISKP
jgi:hypothetical protein